MPEKKNAHIVNPLKSENMGRIQGKVKVVMIRRKFKDISVSNVEKLLTKP